MAEARSPKYSPNKVTAALKRHFGFAAFRPHQHEIVSAILSGRDVFAALPTGGGKSLCYQLPALLTGGLTIVVSPLISLMKDQVDAARENGIAAAFLNSSLPPEAARATWRDLTTGKIRLLYVAPERLSQPQFRAELHRLGGPAAGAGTANGTTTATADQGVSLFAVDEAHCISEWGHEFRPDYRSLGELRSEFPGVPIAAFTATATREVQRDVVRQLDLAEPYEVRASFDRAEISYSVRRKDSVDRQILAFVKNHEGEPGIVYRASRKAVDKTAANLASAGIRAVAYHAGLEDHERRDRQEAFVRDEVEVVVATIAFGMGIDKSNVRWIVHGDLPRSVEAYYQETGRAARDGLPAETVLFHGPGDERTIRYHIERMEVPEERERAEERLREVRRFIDSGICRRKLLLAHFDEEHPGNCGNCDVCTGDVAFADFTVEAQKLLSAAYRTGQRFGGHHLADVVTGNPTDRVLELGHNALPTFGVGSDHDKTWWLDLLRDLEGGGYIRRADGQKSGYLITQSGRRILRGKESFVAARRAPPVKGSTAPRSAEPRPATEPGGIHDRRRADEERFFACLKRIRLRVARER
ncbi:MAG: RecQ family ATP-dependent DNA helicase, partial [Spirochaetes bacterium]|nr:RecQ family ATP-dependent DNA helicase [Spirochaetota bacterium]